VTAGLIEDSDCLHDKVAQTHRTALKQLCSDLSILTSLDLLRRPPIPGDILSDGAPLLVIRLWELFSIWLRVPHLHLHFEWQVSEGLHEITTSFEVLSGLGVDGHRNDWRSERGAIWPEDLVDQDYWFGFSDGIRIIDDFRGYVSYLHLLRRLGVCE